MLGARPDLGLNESQTRTLQYLQEFDLTPIRSRLLRKRRLNPEIVDLAIYEFKRFLGLAILYEQPLPMVSPVIDEVWHCCIQFTRIYEQVCLEGFGRFIHHEPTLVASIEIQEEWRIFADAYRSTYGALPSIWVEER